MIAPDLGQYYSEGLITRKFSSILTASDSGVDLEILEAEVLTVCSLVRYRSTIIFDSSYAVARRSRLATRIFALFSRRTLVLRHETADSDPAIVFGHGDIIDRGIKLIIIILQR